MYDNIFNVLCQAACDSHSQRIEPRKKPVNKWNKHAKDAQRKATKVL